MANALRAVRSVNRKGCVMYVRTTTDGRPHSGRKAANTASAHVCVYREGVAMIARRTADGVQVAIYHTGGYEDPTTRGDPVAVVMMAADDRDRNRGAVIV